MLHKLFSQVSISSLVFIRIVFGILAFLDVVVTWAYYHIYMGAYDSNKFQFKYIGFEWIPTLPEPFMSLFFFAMMALSLFITMGYRYKKSMVGFALGFTYIFLLEKANYLNHGYLFCVLSFLMIFMPANRALSLDVLSGRVQRSVLVPYWSNFLLQFCIGVVYFFGGIAKINGDWLKALPLKLWLPAKKDYFLIGRILEQEWTAWFMSYGGLLLDLFVIPLLIFKKTRWFAFLACLFFHLTNTAIFKIGIFPWLSIALTALFFGADFPLKLIEFLKKKKFIRYLNLNYLKKIRSSGLQNKKLTIKYSDNLKTTISLLIVGFCIVNLCLPLRHHFFEDKVAWTEEGHRYSWRMMLRSKRSNGKFIVQNGDGSKKEVVRPRDMLSKKQSRKCLTHPDMIWQFAQHLTSMYETKWETDSVKVFANVRAKLHSRKYQNFVDPEVNLSIEEWKFFKHKNWIVPLDTEQ